MSSLIERRAQLRVQIHILSCSFRFLICKFWQWLNCCGLRVLGNAVQRPKTNTTIEFSAGCERMFYCTLLVCITEVRAISILFVEFLMVFTCVRNVVMCRSLQVAEAIRARMKELNTMHHKHITQPSFDGGMEQEQEIEITTSEITSLFHKCQKLIQQIGRKVKWVLNSNVLEVQPFWGMYMCMCGEAEGMRAVVTV